jgi:FlgD Ig-like domain
MYKTMLIISICLYSLFSSSNAQYTEWWHSGGEPTFGYYIGAENTDADNAKEIIFLAELSGNHDRMTVIDGVTGSIEWTLDFAHIDNSIRLVDVNNDGRFEILFYGSVSTDSNRYYMYGYSGAGIKQDVEPQRNLYQEISLGQSHPNPLTSITTIDYSLTQKGKVVMKIYNSTGQLVRTLLDGEKEPGKYAVNWDSRDNNGVKVANGSYFYQLEINDQKQAKRMVLVK